MMKKIFAMILALALSISMAACGEGEETTLTGMVVSVDGTKITLMEMDSANMGGQGFTGGQMPEGGFQGFGSFDPENFTMPEGGNMPQWGDGEMPQRPEGSTMPEDFTMPEGYTMPEGMTIPEGMEGMMPGFGGNRGAGTDFGGIASDAETKELDIGNAHISVEIEGGKASGSMDDIKAGTFVTVTVNGKGQVTNVLVSSQSSFGGKNPTRG